MANASAAEEHCVDRPEIALVEKRVNLLGDVDRLAPSVSSVATVEHRHAVGIAAIGRAVSVNGVARDANHHCLVAVAVAYDGGIAISAGFAAVHAVALGQNEFAAPSGAVIVREAVAKIHFAETDVATAGSIVTHGDERSAAIHRNGGNAVGRLPGKCLEKGAFHRIVGGGAQQLGFCRGLCADSQCAGQQEREKRQSHRSFDLERKYEFLSNLERIGKDWRSCRPEIGDLRPVSGKSFPIWRKLERIGRMERRVLCLVLWRCGSPIGQAQTVFGHAVGEVL